MVELKPSKQIKKAEKTKSVTLCMIVKNESHIVKECLESMLPYIDRYDITDTGSTDGTPELIKEFMDEYDVPGEVYLSDWKGFGLSRTEALRNCDGKADYCWMIDADDKLDGDFKYPPLGQHDSVAIRLGRPDFSWFRNQIFRTGMNWQYTGVLHEYAECKEKKPEELKVLKWGDEGGKYYINARTLGARNVGVDPIDKYSKDAETLLSALTNEEDPYYSPNNVRYQFYLAQSYFDCQQFAKSEEAYRKRTEMGEWEEEIFFSLFRIGIIKAITEQSWPDIKEAFLEAWESRPHRAEPLYEISRGYRAQNKPKLAYIYARAGLDIKYPQNDILFLAQDVYDWRMMDEFSAVAFYMNDFTTGFNVTKKLLEDKKFPESEQKRIEENYAAYHNQLVRMQQETEMRNETSRTAQKHMELQKQLEKRKEKKENRIRDSKGITKEKKGTKASIGNAGFKKRKK